MAKDEDKKRGEKKIHSRLNVFLAHYFNLVVIGIVMFALVLGIFYIIIPKYKDIKIEIDAKNIALKEQIKKQTKDLNALRVYRQEYDKFDKEKILRVNVMLPLEYDPEVLYTQMEALIAGKNLILDSLEIILDDNKAGSKLSSSKTSLTGKADLPKEVGSININMSITGVSYAGLKDLLNLIENNLRILDVNSVDFSPGSLTVSLEMTTYYIKK